MPRAGFGADGEYAWLQISSDLTVSLPLGLWVRLLLDPLGISHLTCVLGTGEEALQSLHFFASYKLIFRGHEVWRHKGFAVLPQESLGKTRWLVIRVQSKCLWFLCDLSSAKVSVLADVHRTHSP